LARFKSESSLPGGEGRADQGGPKIRGRGKKGEKKSGRKENVVCGGVNADYREAIPS